MEQRGRNGWQMFGPPRAQNGLSSDKTVATSCYRLLGRQHGKEGIDGSSPSEGLDESPGNGAFSCLQAVSCRA
jgi:hypothetical protein